MLIFLHRQNKSHSNSFPWLVNTDYIETVNQTRNGTLIILDSTTEDAYVDESVENIAKLIGGNEKMAHIKCRYTIPYCTYDFIKKRVHHDESWFCDSYDSECIGQYERPADASNNFVNPTCKHCVYVNGEFEKNCKSYSYEDGWLEMRGASYADHEIEYLEIDGRVLINREEETNA